MFSDADIKLSENEVTFCFGMSKMTVVKEATENEQYFKMKPVEFFEMVGRCAHAKFAGN
jgi:hypothetical protein